MFWKQHTKPEPFCNINQSRQSREWLGLLSAICRSVVMGLHCNNKYLMAKFDWVPYLEGKYLHYYQWFAVIASTVLLVLSFLSFFLYLFLCKLQHHSPARKSLIQTLKSITFNGGFIFLTAIPLIFQALDAISLLEGMLGMMLISVVHIYLDNGRRLWHPEIPFTYQTSTLKSYLQLCLKLTPEAKKRLKIAAVCAVLFPCLFYKTCVSFFNAQVGYYSQSLGIGCNTYLSRMLTLKPSCPPGPPCQLYATVPEDASYAFFLNLHTHQDVDKVIVYYQQLHTADPTVFKQVTAQSYDYLGLEWMAQRKVHSALITGLQPDTKYLTKIFYNNEFWTNAIYRTLPDNNSRPIRMINAGDSGYTHAAINLSKIVSTLQPDIFFMGGDIAYDDNMPACAYTWDYLLGLYGKITATVGYLMPIVAGVGNHDIGLNELSGVNVTVDNYGPAYFLYFPQHYDRNLDGHVIKRVPPLKHRRSFFSVSFANVNYICLDSGYIHHFQGFQKDFMIQTFEENRNKMKFVNYHVPIYSACQKFDKDPTRYLYALFHWVPNFDKYKVMASFENHVHSFKRTKPMVGNTPKQNGTVYLGDGAFGAICHEFCKPDITVDIFETQASTNNFWLSTIYADKVDHIAYDSHGQVLDKFTQYASAYKM